MHSDRMEAGEQLSLACQLMGPAFVERKKSITRDLLAHVETTEELPDGFAYRFASADPWLRTVAEFVEIERQCCPFFTFEIVVEPNDGPLWLRLRGSDQIKAFIRSELSAES